MTDRYDRAEASLRVHEGGYANHPDDPGGATMKGVTQRTYDAFRRRHGRPAQSVRKISDDEVSTIYRRQYWDAINAENLPEGLAYVVFDAAVNSGPGEAVRWLQGLVGARQDGIVGDETVSLVRDRDVIELIERFSAHRLNFMSGLKHWQTFKDGWTRRVGEVQRQGIVWARKGATPAAGEMPALTSTWNAKAEGDPGLPRQIREFLGDKSAMGSVTGLLGSFGAMLSGNGPVQYAMAAVLVIGALAGLWLVVNRRKSQA